MSSLISLRFTLLLAGHCLGTQAATIIYLESSIVLHHHIANKSLTATLTEITQTLPITSTYNFAIPQIGVNFTCSCDGDPRQICSSRVKGDPSIASHCTKSTDSCPGAGSSTIIYDIRANRDQNSDVYTALKVSQNPKQTIYKFSFTIGSNVWTMLVPRGISKFIVSNQLVVQLKENKPIFNPVVNIEWFYGKKGSKNLRTTFAMNNIDEWQVDKMGWYKQTTSNKTFNYNKTELLRKFKPLNHDCNTLKFQYKLDVAHYYDRKGLLREELKSISMQEAAYIPIDDITINEVKMEATINYKHVLSKEVQMSIPDKKNYFLFGAVIHLDRFGNKVLILKVMETIKDLIMVNIGYPGLTVFTHSFYHDGTTTTYTNRLSTEIVGDQWICLHPKKHYFKVTCAYAKYTEEMFQQPEKKVVLVRCNLPFYDAEIEDTASIGSINSISLLTCITFVISWAVGRNI